LILKQLYASHCKPNTTSYPGSASRGPASWVLRIEKRAPLAFSSINLRKGRHLGNQQTHANLCEELHLVEVALARFLCHVEVVPLTARRWVLKWLVAAKAMAIVM
jgi:hypothetical protein